MIEIVDAGANDAAVIASIHVASWKATYRGILSDDYLDGEADRERVDYWRAAMEAGRYSVVKLACVDAQVVGFVALRDDPEDEGYAMTIEHLHLLPRAKGQGLGKKLMLAAARAVKHSGGSNICLWVFEDNAPAIGFYERLGGKTDAHGIDVMADKPDRRIGWHDLDGLIEFCEAGS